MLNDVRPPVPVPALTRASRREPSMTFEAVDGVPLGRKFPTSLSTEDVDELLGVVRGCQVRLGVPRSHSRLRLIG